ncbi:MAG: hypothetical protein ACPGLV_10795 [Bacteroidia bacterium]
MKTAKNINSIFWNKNNKIAFAAGFVPTILLLLYASFGFETMSKTAPGVNLLISSVLGFSAIIAGLISVTYLSFTYMFMQSETE